MQKTWFLNHYRQSPQNVGAAVPILSEEFTRPDIFGDVPHAEAETQQLNG